MSNEGKGSAAAGRVHFNVTAGVRNPGIPPEPLAEEFVAAVVAGLVEGEMFVEGGNAQVENLGMGRLSLRVGDRHFILEIAEVSA